MIFWNMKLIKVFVYKIIIRIMKENKGDGSFNKVLNINFLNI